MNAKTMIPLALAVVLGLVAAKLVVTAVQHKPVAMTNTGNLVTVVVAKRDAAPGAVLTKDDLGTAKVPADAAPGQVFANPDELVGRTPVTPIVRGQTIMETLLAPTGAGSGLQSLVPRGMRAITLQVDEYSGVGGMVEPGCRVDIVAQIRDEKSNHQVVRTVLQNIRVAAIGKNLTPPAPAKAGDPVPPAATSVTLLCQPRQAQALEMAQMASRPWLVLRSTRDPAELTLDSTTLAELTGEGTTDAGGGAFAGLLSLFGDHKAAATPTTMPTAAPMPPAVATGEKPTGPVTPVSMTKTTPTAPATIRKTVTVIRGGAETQVTFDVPAPKQPEAVKPAMDPAAEPATDDDNTNTVDISPKER